MQKVLVIGSKGMLGSSVAAFFAENNFVVSAIDKSDEFDFTNKSDIRNILQNQQPDIVINCAAFTDVEACEDLAMLDLAQAVNTQAPIDLVDLCVEFNTTCIHISTDYVFSDNSQSGHIESDITERAMNIYGQTKLEAEQGIINLLGGLTGSDFVNQTAKIYIIRISWLFGKNAKNFVNKVLTKAATETELTIVDDEVGCPTYTQDVIQAMDYILKNKLNSGIFHVTSSNSCSRYDFASYILAKTNPEVQVKPCKLADFSRKAKIPNFSILKNTKLPSQRTWQAMVDDFLGK